MEEVGNELDVFVDQNLYFEMGFYIRVNREYWTDACYWFLDPWMILPGKKFHFRSIRGFLRPAAFLDTG